MGNELLHEVGHDDGFATAKLGRGEAVVKDTGNEFANLVTEALAIPLVEVLLVLILVLEAELKVVGFPPRSWNESVALGARNNEVAFGLHFKVKFEGTHDTGYVK